MLDTVLNSRKSKPGSDESDRIAERDVVKSAADMLAATRFLNSSSGYKAASLLVYIVDKRLPSRLFNHSFDSLDNMNLLVAFVMSRLALSCSLMTALSVFFKFIPS